jgi:hypothetical protein
VPYVRRLDRIGLRFDFEQEVHDVLEGDVGSMWRVPASPARVVADPFFSDVTEGPVGSFNPQLCVLAEGFDGDGWIEHAKLVGQPRVIDLQDEPRFDYGLILALEHRCHRIDVFLFRRVILIEEEVAEPAWSKDWEEEVFDLPAGLRDARLDHRELMRDGVLAFVLHGTGDHRPVRGRRVDDAGSWDVAKLVVDGIELSKLRHMAFLLAHQDGGALAGLERPHFNAGDPAVIVDLVAPFPKLAVAVDVVAEFHLLAHSVGDASLHEPVKCGLVAVGAGFHDRRDIVGIRQPPCVRCEDPLRAPLHRSPPPVGLGPPKMRCVVCPGNHKQLIMEH